MRAFQNCQKVGTMFSIGRAMGDFGRFWRFWPFWADFGPNFGRFLADFFAFPKKQICDDSKTVKNMAACLQSAELRTLPLQVGHLCQKVIAFCPLWLAGVCVCVGPLMECT